MIKVTQEDYLAVIAGLSHKQRQELTRANGGSVVSWRDQHNNTIALAFRVKHDLPWVYCIAEGQQEKAA